MNDDNIKRFMDLFKVFEQETKKAANLKNETLSNCINHLKNKRYEPWYSNANFIDLCRDIRNFESHQLNKNYYSISEQTITELERIVEQIKRPITVYEKCNKSVYSKTVSDKVLETMEVMLSKDYTHIPIYSDDRKELVGIFTKNTLFKSILDEQIVMVDNDTDFDSIRKSIIQTKSDSRIRFVPKNKLFNEIVFEFMQCFKNKDKVDCLMITNNGKPNEQVIGVLTAWGIIGRL